MVELDSPVGPLQIFATRQGVCAVTFDRTTPANAGDGSQEADVIERRAADQLREYFAGKRRTFDLPLDLHGTDFQREAWTALRTIPFGETRTYSEEANIMGRPNAVRAAGSANGRNPVPIIVPCHRVVASNGLGGFSSGIERKVLLLKHEGQLRL